MSDGQRKPNLGRADRVLPGIWRLRLPLSWTAVPHVNAWALSAGDGIVLVDTGMHEEGALEELERALAQIGRRLEDVRLLVCTHAHSDHYGLAAPIVERAGCELWMHPRHQHMTRSMEDPERALAQRIEVARQSGVPLEPLRQWAEERRRDPKPNIAEVIEPHRELLPGVEVETDHGRWSVHYTPGHAPSHVVLFEPQSAPAAERRPHPRARVRLLRLRLDAGPRGRVPRRARHGRGPRRPPVPTGARPPVRRRAGAHRGEPRRDPSAARRDRRSRRARRRSHRVRPGAARARPGRGLDDELGADDHALLPHPPRAGGAGGARQVAW